MSSSNLFLSLFSDKFTCSKEQDIFELSVKIIIEIERLNTILSKFKSLDIRDDNNYISVINPMLEIEKYISDMESIADGKITQEGKSHIKLIKDNITHMWVEESDYRNRKSRFVDNQFADQLQQLKESSNAIHCRILQSPALSECLKDTSKRSSYINQNDYCNSNKYQIGEQIYL